MHLRIHLVGFLWLALLLPAILGAQTPTATPSSLTIDQTAVSIRVDGHLGDWPSARMFRLDQKAQIVQGKSVWQGEDDFSSRVFLTYDDQYLFISAIVKKNGKKVVNDNKTFSLPNGDCLELLIGTDPTQQNTLLDQGDYHLAFSPGTDCKDPQVFCLNRNSTVPGARLIARSLTNGYVLEGSVPLVFLEGLKLGPGKSFRVGLVLDGGGALSGLRVLRMVYGGNAVDLDDPSTWALAQWTGSALLEVPFKKSLDLNSNLVVDGTKGASYLGQRDITGQVTDSGQKPLSGVKVRVWPKGAEAETDAKGHFVLKRTKIYAGTMVCASKKGFVSSIAALPSKGKPIALMLSEVPEGLRNLKGKMSPYFIGMVLPCLDPASFDAFLAKERPQIEPLHLGTMRLAAPATPLSQADHLKVIGSFEAFARSLGAEPMVTLSLEDPSVGIAYFQANARADRITPPIRFWALGDEQDLLSTSGTDQNNAYTYLNKFRSIANALKIWAPDILLWGPEPGGDAPRAEMDWVTPLLKYDGDVLNGVSIHRYGWGQGVTLTAEKVQESLRHEIDTLVGLADRVSQNSALDLPFAITADQAVRGPNAAPVTAGEARMLPAIWEADQRGMFLKGGLPMLLAGEGIWNDPSGPSYWALRLWSQMKRGIVLNAVSQESLVSVYATQDPKTRDVTLMLINQADHYWRPKIRLNGEDDLVSVEAGLDQRYDFECPSLSISLLEIHADRSTGQAWVLDPDSARNGAPPHTVSLKPW